MSALIQSGEQAPVAMLNALQSAMSDNPTLAKFVSERVALQVLPDVVLSRREASFSFPSHL